MKSFITKLNELDPNILFTFRRDDLTIDLSKLENFYIFNKKTSDYFQPKLFKVSNVNKEVPDDIVFNPIPINEESSDNDTSLSIGLNDLSYNGLVYYYNDPMFNSEITGIQTNREYNWLWQLKFEQNENITSGKFIDYNAYDDYVVAVIDTDGNGKEILTAPFLGGYQSQDDLTESWYSQINLGAIKPSGDDGISDNTIHVNYESGENLNRDILGSDWDTYRAYDGQNVNLNTLTYTKTNVRPIKIALINPRTGEIYDSKKFIYDPNTSPNNTNTKLYTPVYDVFDIDYPSNIGEVTNKPKIQNISIDKYNYSTYVNDRYDFTENGTMPKVDSTYSGYSNSIYVTVKNSKIPDRNAMKFAYSSTYMYTVMRFMHLELRVSNNQLYFYDIEKNISIFNTSIITNPICNIACKNRYELLSGNNPSANYFSYRMHYEFILNGSKFNFYKDYKGEKINRKFRGVGDDFFVVPTFANMPIYFGNINRWGALYSTTTYSVKFKNKEYIHNVPSILRTDTPQNRIYIDNIAMSYSINFTSSDIYDDLNYRLYSTDNNIYTKYLFNKWRCNSINTDMASIPNDFNYSSTNIDSNMRISGNGYFKHNKIKNHPAFSDCIYFNDVLGLVKTYDTWEIRGNLTINFWINTSQTSRGCIFTDFNKESDNGRGFYVGISDGGYLQIIFNNVQIRTYYDIHISDGNWHMITLVNMMVGQYWDNNWYTNTDNYLQVYFDSNLVDTIYDYSVVNSGLNTNYHLYFMGHPNKNYTTGSLSNIEFYKTRFKEVDIKRLYSGNILHYITGQVFYKNKPTNTEVRCYNNETGELIDIIYTDGSNGNFMYQYYKNLDIYIITKGVDKNFGEIQVIGPVEPKS